MAKTKLNSDVDRFFEKLKSENISLTEEYVKENLNIESTNDYGNILHALINYRYDEDKVLETIKILLDLGVNPNYQGKQNGYTFIHLSLYGYTDNNKDISYNENFIIKLITLVRQYGFNVNIKDNDSETIAEAAMASEIYTGRILPIIEALGESFEIGKNILNTYDKYLKESNGIWQKRLEDEKSDVYEFVQKKLLNPVEIEQELKKVSSELSTKLLENSTYNSFKEMYAKIHDLVIKLNELLNKAHNFDINTEDYALIIENTNKIISSILESEISNIKKQPKEADINVFILIANTFALKSLVKVGTTIANEYKAYKEKLFESANSVKTINDGKSVKESLIETEIREELDKIIDLKIAKLTEIIQSIMDSLTKYDNIFASFSPYIDVSKLETAYAYEDMDEKELKKAQDEVDGEIEKLNQEILIYITEQYRKIKTSLMPAISAGYITIDDLTNCFNIALERPKEKNRKGKTGRS